MTIKRASAMLAASSVFALSLSGLAYADDVNVSNTGPGSTNNATITNNNSSTVNNDNDVTVTNTNNQTATSGSADVSQNTNAGSATSGEASNSATTMTTVSIDNSGAGSCVCDPGSGGAGGGGNPGSGGATGQGGAGGASSGSSASSVGGPSSGLLPKAGPSDPVDVSAMRNNVLGVAAPTPEEIKKTSNLSTGLLIAAALLSLIGAIGSAVYASKKEKVA